MLHVFWRQCLLSTPAKLRTRITSTAWFSATPSSTSVCDWYWQSERPWAWFPSVSLEVIQVRVIFSRNPGGNLLRAYEALGSREVTRHYSRLHRPLLEKLKGYKHIQPSQLASQSLSHTSSLCCCGSAKAENQFSSFLLPACQSSSLNRGDFWGQSGWNRWLRGSISILQDSRWL